MADGQGGYWKRMAESLWSESSLPVLDGLRAISCIWVASSEGASLWQYAAPKLIQPLYALWWPVALPFNGDSGVDFFFLISGYLIGRRVLAEVARSNDFAWMRFCSWRAFRILPVFWLAIAVAVATMGFEVCSVAMWRKLLLIEDVSANLMPDDEGLCVPQSWSVAVEMKLYVLTPLVVSSAFRVGRVFGVPPTRVLTAICASFWVACCGARLAALHAVAAQAGSIWYTGFQYRCAPFFAGVTAAVLLSEQDVPAGPPKVSAAREGMAAAALHGTLTALSWAALLVTVLYGGGGPLTGFNVPLAKYPFGLRGAQAHFVLGRPLIGAATSYLLWKTLTGRGPRLHRALAAPIWRPLARLSYSAYMMQMANYVVSIPILSALGNAKGAGAPAQAVSALSETSLLVLFYVWIVLYVLFAFLVAVPSYVLVEYPGMTCGRRVARALQRPAALPARGDLLKALV
mmetsp:Transcript_53430/g.159477  ORF Transcript_53430/g.159477 Transcript_53430/m.159477 type:complete len:459 (+) Transcript_53430:72-1448(+)